MSEAKVCIHHESSSDAGGLILSNRYDSVGLPSFCIIYHLTLKDLPYGIRFRKNY